MTIEWYPPVALQILARMSNYQKEVLSESERRQTWGCSVSVDCNYKQSNEYNRRLLPLWSSCDEIEYQDWVLSSGTNQFLSLSEIMAWCDNEVPQTHSGLNHLSTLDSSILWGLHEFSCEVILSETTRCIFSTDEPLSLNHHAWGLSHSVKTFPSQFNHSGKYTCNWPAQTALIAPLIEKRTSKFVLLRAVYNGKNPVNARKGGKADKKMQKFPKNQLEKCKQSETHTKQSSFTSFKVPIYNIHSAQDCIHFGDCMQKRGDSRREGKIPPGA